MIGGNTKALYQEKRLTGTNEIGERVYEWVTIEELKGWLDLVSQTTNRNEYKTKIEGSTDVFVCDYKAIDENIENKRILIGVKNYEVLYIDNPMNLNQHLEIFLKYTGRQ